MSPVASGAKAKAEAWARMLTARVRGVAARALQPRIEALTGLSSIEHTQPNDIFICGYPKSGNTWFQHMVAAVVFGTDVELAPDTLMNELVPDVHFKAYYRRFSNPCFFKSHHLPRPSYRRIVYLLRDGRDAMVSYFHHLTAMSGAVDFLAAVKNGEGLFPSKWHEHVERFMDNPHHAEMIVIRYEDLKRDTLGQLRRFCEFAAIDRDEATLARAIAKTSFEAMRNKENKHGWETPGWPKDKPFVRRGQVGSYRDEMPPDVLQAFMRDAERTLASQGYL
jgi:sulfotransferase family protein